MSNIKTILSPLPAILRALNDNPMACIVVVTLCALAFAAFAVYRIT